MADWKLEQLNVEHSRVEVLQPGETGPGLSWLLTLVNIKDIFVFAGSPALYIAAKGVVDAIKRHDAQAIITATADLNAAVLKSEGVQGETLH